MWWEIIPSGTIIGICLAIPTFASMYWNEAFYGNPFRRRLEYCFERNMFARDGRIGGVAWNIKGLDAIPDEE